MRSAKPLIVPIASVAVISLVLMTVAAAWAAGKERILHNFRGSDGCYPGAGLIFDASGNLYSTIVEDSVFELTPGTNGKWTETVLYKTSHAVTPFFAGLIFDAAGNLYTTTSNGGDFYCGIYNDGCGTVFELTPGANGKWNHTELYRFHGKDGAFPDAGLIFDAQGNLYGTTSNEDNSNPCLYGSCGTVFKLSPGQNGKWTETVLHRFSGKNGDGASPAASLIFDAAGNLYGTTPYGGSNLCSGGCGIVFKLTPSSSGKWSETILHTFSGSDGAYPQAGLIFDAAGSLYSTTSNGVVGNYCLYGSCGTVFKLTPDTGGKWNETVLHSFQGADGSSPYSGLVFDAKGNLFGTTLTNVFKLAPGANGEWTETVLHTFGRVEYGIESHAGVILDTAGNLYGTTVRGGSGYCGVVFEVSP